MSRQIFNLHSQSERRRMLRAHMPKPEVILWKHLQNKKIADAKIRRQYGVGPYIVDFYCAEVRLAIEIDGTDHTADANSVADIERTKFLENFGITVIRFTNDDVLHGLQHVLDIISKTIVAFRKDSKVHRHSTEMSK